MKLLDFNTYNIQVVSKNSRNFFKITAQSKQDALDFLDSILDYIPDIIICNLQSNENIEVV